jgi:hypothetical protein
MQRVRLSTAHAHILLSDKQTCDQPPPAARREPLAVRRPVPPVVERGRAVVDPGRLASLDRKLTIRVPADHTYFSLDPDTLHQVDAIVFVKAIRA